MVYKITSDVLLMNASIDIYCERLGPEVWSEPMNAITNLSFLIAAILAFRLALRHNQAARRAEVLALIVLVVLIGVGSSLFHTYATRWAQLADVLPILGFQIGFLWVYSRRIIRLPNYQSILLLVGFTTLIVLFAQLPPEWLNGSLGYAPALIYIFGFGIYHRLNQCIDSWILLKAGLLFALSLAFRSVDMLICPSISMGSHFIWHLFNGWVLFLCLKALIKNIGKQHPNKNSA